MGLMFRKVSAMAEVSMMTSKHLLKLKILALIDIYKLIFFNERHLQNFDKNNRTTNAVLEQLTVILLRLTRNDN
jgi:hypothetical protein